MQDNVTRRGNASDLILPLVKKTESEINNNCMFSVTSAVTVRVPKSSNNSNNCLAFHFTHDYADDEDDSASFRIVMWFNM